ncbi:MAG: hypothetical protein IPO81_18820 [Kouleothrix sp.]|nr:hypothetical protein [Kouleothrix sp.]
MSPIAIPKRGGAPTQPHRWRGIRVNLYLYAALILVVFLGTIEGAKLAGLWSTSGKLTASGEAVQITGNDPAEVKGWMTIKDVITAYRVPKAAFYAQFALPADMPETMALKDIEPVVPAFSVTDLRAWLAARTAP